MLKYTVPALMTMSSPDKQELLSKIGQRITCPKCGDKGRVAVYVAKYKKDGEVKEYYYLVVNHTMTKCVLFRLEKDEVRGPRTFREMEEMGMTARALATGAAGYASVERVVTKSDDRRGKVYVPAEWVGKRVRVVLLEPLGKEKGREATKEEGATGKPEERVTRQPQVRASGGARKGKARKERSPKGTKREI